MWLGWGLILGVVRVGSGCGWGAAWMWLGWVLGLGVVGVESGCGSGEFRVWLQRGQEQEVGRGLNWCLELVTARIRRMGGR